MIAHNFPELDGISDLNLKAAFTLKAIEAMSTETDGVRVEVRRR